MPVGAGERVGGRPEHPLRHSELRCHRCKRLRRAASQDRSGTGSTSPSGRTRTRCSCRRATTRAGRSIPPVPPAIGRLPQRAVSSDVADVERRAVPRHVGMIPGQPDQTACRRAKAAASRRSRGPREDASRLGAGIGQIDGDDGVDRLACAVWSSRTPIQRLRCWSISPSANRQSRPVLGGAGVSGSRLAPRRAPPIKAAVGEIGEIERAIRHGPRPAAVFVHAGAHIESVRGDV